MGRNRDKPRISPNPNGVAWSNDTSKFGSRMLQQMGWQQGEGLGKHSSGMTQHVKINYKSDTLGLGAAQQNLNDSSSVYSTNTFLFNQVLQKLSVYRQSAPPPPPPPSSSSSSSSSSAAASAAAASPPLSYTTQGDEDTSKASSNGDTLHVGRNRVVYDKFIKAKNVRNYSQEDLSAIFGGEIPQTETSNGDTKTTATDIDTTSDAVISPPELVTSTTSINDYFDQRLRLMGFVRQSKPENDDDTSSSPSLQKPPSPDNTVDMENDIARTNEKRTKKDKKLRKEKKDKKKAKKRKHQHSDTDSPPSENGGKHDGDNKRKHKKNRKRKHGESGTTSGSDDDDDDSLIHKQRKAE